MKYYTSDLHFYHKNIIKYENRPFINIAEMNNVMIENWNRKVKNSDEIYILGDFAFCSGAQANELLKRLNGQKFLIKGNHDSFLKDREFNKSNFVWIRDYARIQDGNTEIVLFHYPIAVWDKQHHGSLHFYGHIHSNGTTRHPLTVELTNAFNVGVDCWNFEPTTLEEIMSRNK